MSSYEDHFMEIARQTPLEQREKKLDDIIYDFIHRQGVTSLGYGLNLMDMESENYGCSPAQVMVDVIHFCLEQHWLDEQEYWYVLKGSPEHVELPPYLYSCRYPMSRDKSIENLKLAGPFDTEDEALKWSDENGVDLEYA